MMPMIAHNPLDKIHPLLHEALQSDERSSTNVQVEIGVMVKNNILT